VDASDSGIDCCFCGIGVVMVMAGEDWVAVEVSDGESLAVEVVGGGAGFFVSDSGTARWVLSLDKYAADLLVWDGAGCRVAEACREDSGGGV